MSRIGKGIIHRKILTLQTQSILETSRGFETLLQPITLRQNFIISLLPPLLIEQP